VEVKKANRTKSLSMNILWINMIVRTPFVFPKRNLVLRIISNGCHFT